MAEYNPSKIIKDGNTYNFRDTTKIPLSGSNKISGDLIPSTDNAIDIGSSTKNIKMLYTKGITINGTQFLPSDYATLSSLSTVATSGSYTDLSDKPTIPTVNDGTLTIQQNGTAVDTFTANSSTDKTVNIQCVDLTNNQTVAGNKEFTGTTTAHDVIPSATDTYNLGGSSYQWNNAYIKSLTINGTACGDILTHNASEFVNVTGAQTISGVKSFKDTIIRNVGNFTAGVAPTAQTICLVLKHTNNDSTQNANSILSYMFTSGESMCELTQNPCIGSIARTWFRTNTDGSYSIYSYTKNGSLGTTSYRWKDVQTEKINNLNPGALSLPSMDYISLDTTNFDVTATTIGAFTSTIDGWAILSMTQKNKPFGIWILQGSYRVTFHSVYHDGDYLVFALIPVRANVTMTVYCTADDIDSTRKVYWLRLFPCQGNV